MALNLTSPGTDAALTSDVTGNEHVVHHRDADRAALLAALAALDPDVGLGAVVTALGGTLAVSAASLPLPTGAASQTTLAAVLAKMIAAPATEAKQDTVIGHVDGIETLLTNLLAQLRSATSHIAITPGAGAIAGGPVRRLVIGGAGTVTVTANGVTVEYAVVAGQQLDIAATHVTAATATGIVGQF